MAKFLRVKVLHKTTAREIVQLINVDHVLRIMPLNLVEMMERALKLRPESGGSLLKEVAAELNVQSGIVMAHGSVHEGMLGNSHELLSTETFEELEAQLRAVTGS